MQMSGERRERKREEEEAGSKGSIYTREEIT
jgi:hypothetical protein